MKKTMVLIVASAAALLLAQNGRCSGNNAAIFESFEQAGLGSLPEAYQNDRQGPSDTGAQLTATWYDVSTTNLVAYYATQQPANNGGPPYSALPFKQVFPNGTSFGATNVFLAWNNHLVTNQWSAAALTGNGGGVGTIAFTNIQPSAVAWGLSGTNRYLMFGGLFTGGGNSAISVNLAQYTWLGGGFDPLLRVGTGWITNTIEANDQVNYITWETSGKYADGFLVQGNFTYVADSDGTYGPVNGSTGVYWNPATRLWDQSSL